jgi:acyl-CoA synthetase (NDP forming)
MSTAALDLTSVAEREGQAENTGPRPVLAPESVVVIGASRRQGTAGRAILDNILAGGYAGRVYVVNPRARQIRGERCLTSVLHLPEPADLAVIAVPAAAVLDVAEQCGQRGVRSLVVITSGLDVAACADLLAVCRPHGMRLVGPDCFGVAVPGIGLDATFAVLTTCAGRADREALFEQAGVITTRGFGELIEATALLATQPVPAGCTVAIVSNAGSAGRLADDLPEVTALDLDGTMVTNARIKLEHYEPQDPFLRKPC